MNFATAIITWYNSNKRDLPWRNTNNPYLIWLSEIILQQTRVEQGTPYYLKFREHFPTVTHLADADESEVLKLWQGLGYYSRARNLHATAKHIATEFKGVFPNTYTEIVKLKGIGQYTAGAIASFAFNEAQPVVDGNVYRILSRYYGITTPIDSTTGKNHFYELASELLDKNRPGLFNQAIMEFGAMQCMPKNPQCDTCPLSGSCIALEKKSVGLLPVKSKKTKVSDRFFYYLVIEKETGLYLKHRADNDIWKGLYDFPMLESALEWPIDFLTDFNFLRELLGTSDCHLMSVSDTYKHILSHQRIYARFLFLSCKSNRPLLFDTQKAQDVLSRYSKKAGQKKLRKELKLHLSGSQLIFKSALKNYAIPRLIERYLQAKKLL